MNGVGFNPYALAVARWNGMDGVARGAALVSAGSLTLVLMATLVKHLGEDLPAFEILFFRSLVGFFFVLPVFFRNPMEPFRTNGRGCTSRAAPSAQSATSASSGR